jgi:hypothetical protein
MPYIHWVTRQNKLEIPRDKDEVKNLTTSEKSTNAMGEEVCTSWSCFLKKENGKHEGSEADDEKVGTMGNKHEKVEQPTDAAAIGFPHATNY